MNIKHTLGVNAEVGNTLIEVKVGVRAVRNLRTGVMDLAHRLTQKNAQQRALLVLADPQITQERLEREWRAAQETLRPEVMERISLVVFKDGHFRGLPQDLDPQIRSQLEIVLRDQVASRRVRIHSGATYYEIFKVLIHQWLLDKGPMTADWVARTVGCNYRTVASALFRLGSTIKRHSDRRIELAHFPREEWAELVAVSNQTRSTVRFADRSGQPRSPESLHRRLTDRYLAAIRGQSQPTELLLGRLAKMEQPNIGVGGVFGAKHYYPNLDLTGSPRLDLTIHGNRVDWGFVEQLDPALRRVQDPSEPANLVAHFLRRHDPLFDREPEGALWADPVECLLDLHEMRMESQAREFLNSFPSARGKT
jgi:hypothetical protein